MYEHYRTHENMNFSCCQKQPFLWKLTKDWVKKKVEEDSLLKNCYSIGQKWILYTSCWRLLPFSPLPALPVNAIAIPSNGWLQNLATLSLDKRNWLEKKSISHSFGGSMGKNQLRTHGCVPKTSSKTNKN